MTDIKEEDIEVIDDRTSWGKYNGGRQLIIKTNNQKQLKKQILENQKLMELVEKRIKNPFWEVHTENLTHDSLVQYSQTELQMMIGNKIKLFCETLLRESQQ